MKKLTVFVIALWGVGHLYGQKVIDKLWPESSSEHRDKQWEARKRMEEKLRADRERLDQERAARQPAPWQEREGQRVERTNLAPAVPAAAQGAAGWQEREQERVDRINASREQGARRIRNEGACAAARSNLAAISMVEKAPGTFELKSGGKVATEAEKTAARAESEKFINENCR